MARYFSLAEAEELLPQVEEALREAIALRAAYTEAEAVLEGAQRRILMAGGMQPDHSRLLRERARRDASAAQLKTALEKIQGLGCEVKDLDTGLVDFPTLFRGRAVYLCWKLGEQGITWWHGLEEGFRGRKPIDAAFLANHRGGNVQ